MIKHRSSKNRIAQVISLFFAIYPTIFMRLVHYGMVESPEKQFTPRLSLKTLYAKLSSSSGFVWLVRQLTPAVKNQFILVTIPGISFCPELKRVYPAGRITAHIIGFPNVDNAGVAGLENWIGGQGIDDIRHVRLAKGESLAPIITSIDLRVQHALHNELSKALVQYGAAGVGGVILNIKSAETIALASLPDFAPHFPSKAQLPDRLNRIDPELPEIVKPMKARY